MEVEDRAGGQIGGPVSRRGLQARLDKGESFVLYVPATREKLGWVWGHAVLAESIYSQSLREQLLDWGWRPQSLTISDDEIAAMSRREMQRDPAEWGGSGLQPDMGILLETLATGVAPGEDERLVFDLTVEQAGLPAFDEGDVRRWRNRALARLLVTQAHQNAPQLVGDGHELLIVGNQHTFALDLLGRWLDSLRLSRGLPAMIMEVDVIASLGNALGSADARQGPFLSLAAERAVFVNTCRELAQKGGKDLLQTLADLKEAIQRHVSGFWGDMTQGSQSLPWRELARLSEAAGDLLEAAQVKAWANPEEAVAWYTNNGWRVDQAGEELLRNLEMPAPELLELIAPLRAAYRARWEGLLIQWSEVWTVAGCPLPKAPTGGEWLAEVLSTKRATAILVADAFRYDLARTLADRLNASEGVDRASVAHARAPLPSITPLGMSMALPLAEVDLTADIVDGKWQVRYKGNTPNLAIAQQRKEWWQQYGKVEPECIIGVPAVLLGNVPAPDTKRTRLVIYDDAIDKLGHDDELEAMGGGLIIDRYLKTIEGLRRAGWQRVAMLTDHGYIHWSDSHEQSVPLPAPDPAYSQRRAAAYPLETRLQGPQGLAPGGKWRVAVPRGAASFRAYGGLGYFHGGASLQEWIVPCVLVEWPSKARPVRITLEPIDKILGLRPLISLHVALDPVPIEDMLARQVDVLIRKAADRSLLFRSGSVMVTPDQEEVSVPLQVIEGMEAERGTKLRVEVRDTNTEEVLDERISTLMIEITGW